MEASGSKFTRWRVFIGIGISLAALAVVSLFFDLQQVFDALLQADWQALAMALLLYGISYLPRARAWHLILNEEVSFSRVFLTMHVGYFLNNTLPFRLGELGRAFLLGRGGLGFWRVFSTILIERFLDLAFATGLLLGTLPFVLEASFAAQSALYAGIIVILGMIVLYLLALNRTWALSQFERWEVRWPWLTKLGPKRVTAFLDGLAVLSSPSRFFRIVLWLGFSWAMAIFVQFLILRAFLPSAKLFWAGFGMGASSLSVAVPSSPGYVGVFEAALVGALALLGVSTSAAFAYALTTHFFYFLITGIFGGYGLSREGESLKNIFQKVSRIKS